MLTATGDDLRLADYPHRGDVWLANLDKQRPVVILTRDPMGLHLNALHMLYATHTRHGVSSEVDVGEADDFDDGSVLNADNLRLVRQQDLVRHVGAVRAETLDAICQAIAFALACPEARPSLGPGNR